LEIYYVDSSPSNGTFLGYVSNSQTLNETVHEHIYYLIMCFKSYLCCSGKARKASNADISVIFTDFFFFFLLTFWFREFVFEWDLDQACEICWCLRAIAEIWCWGAQYEKFIDRNCGAYDGGTWEITGTRVVLLSS